MNAQDKNPEPDWIDTWIASSIGICGLAAYVHTLAPDVLYADTAEFQALAYTLGMTHSTGYPVYLLLARLVGFLPIGTLAWRINLFSAICAAITLSFLYLIIRYLTSNRFAAVLAVSAFGISYTFWSQAIIAEVYTPGTAFLAAVIFLLWRWCQAPLERSLSLMTAATLVGLSLGVHAYTALIAPVAVAFVIWNLLAQRIPLKRWIPSMGVGLAGALLGTGLFLLSFYLIDRHNPPSSFIRVMLYPSRSIWGLQPGDFTSPIERLWLTIAGKQWQDAMFPKGVVFPWGEMEAYLSRLIGNEFSIFLLLIAIFGLAAVLRLRPDIGAFILLAYILLAFFILNYYPGDKYIFYLPLNLLVVIAAGAGMGFLLELSRNYRAIQVVLGIILLLVVFQPTLVSRWQALRLGLATFVKEDYAYPVKDLAEPRQVASSWAAAVPDDAVMLLNWRALYTTYYVAAVEQGRANILIYEATPHGGDGTIAPTLITEIKNALLEGRPVYTEDPYAPLEAQFDVEKVPGVNLYQISFY
jgi:hypothetical protein